jgi:hypothetical protein
MEQMHNTITQQEAIIRRVGLVMTALSCVYLALYILLAH